MKHTLFIALIGIASAFTSCGGSSTENAANSDTAAAKTDTVKQMAIKEENVDIKADTTTMKSFVAYDGSKTDKRPIVLVVPEWWGVTDFTKSKARQLAQEGYFALVVDMYGNGTTADNPGDAMKYAQGFYKNAKLATSRLLAALNKA